MEEESSKKTEQTSTTAIPPLIGLTLDGRYYIEQKLGGGGIGDVYLARDKPELMGRKVVIKVLKENSLEDDWIVTKFRQEIEALTRIDDPGVVGVLDAGSLPNGHPYLVMQFVDGENLRAHMRPGRGMDFADVWQILQTIGRTLTAAHDKDVIHRDLKPENVMVRRRSDGTWQVKVIDFGIAKIRNSLVAPTTVTGKVAGTVTYMAPEQLQGRRVSVPADVYALGVIAYEMLTGRIPFNPETPFQLSELQRAGAPLSPVALRPGLPHVAEEAIMKALSYPPLQRYQRACDFGDDLSRALREFGDDAVTLSKPTIEVVARDEQGSAEDTPVTEFYAPATGTADQIPSRRSRASWLVAFSLLLIVVIVGLGGWLYLSKAVEPERALTYWLTVQRMYNSAPIGEPFEAAGRDYFHTGDRFSLNIVAREAGALYLVSEGHNENGLTEWNILFPTQKNNDGLATIDANQTVKTGTYRFTGSTGVEKIWIVWSSGAEPLMDSIFQGALRDGVIRDLAQQEQLQNFLKQNEGIETELVQDEVSSRASLKGRGRILVKPLSLSHKPS